MAPNSEKGSFARDPHIPACDGIRGLAIVLVIVGHTGVGRMPTSSVQHLGWMGVDLFFVLSGFLITTILLDTKGTPHFFRNFYARRTLRIFPLYYALLMAVFFVAPLFGARVPRGAPWYFLFVSNFGEVVGNLRPPGRLGVLWSLAIEEQFYWIWPLLVARLSSRALLWFLMSVLVLEPALRGSLLVLDATPAAIYVATPTRLDGLAIGALIAMMVRQKLSRDWLASHASRTIVVGVLIFCGARFFDQTGSFSGRDYNGSGVQIAGFSGLALAFGGVVSRALTAPPESAWRRFFDSPILGFFGRFSYAMYLVHYPLVTHARPFIDPLVRGASTVQRELVQGTFTLGMLLVVLGLAFVSFHACEKHFLKLKRYFPYQRDGVSPSAH